LIDEKIKFFLFFAPANFCGYSTLQIRDVADDTLFDDDSQRFI